MSRTVIEQIELFKLDELPQDKQEKAYEKWYQSEEYPYGDDNEESLNKFCEIFPVKVTEWEYGYHNNIDFNMTCDDEISELRGIRLSTYIWNNYKDYLFIPKFQYKGAIGGNSKTRYSNLYKGNSCVLTGYCIDDDILEPVYKFLEKPYDINFEELMSECLNSWISACDDDNSHYFSLENFKEEVVSNDWEFTADGEIYY